MKFHSPFVYAFALVASLFLASCGGGGASGNPNQGGPISVSPDNGTFYAGVPATITLQGGRRPYSLTSSEPGVLPVPAIVDSNSVDVIPNNPGVIDVGLQPGALPVRTVVISVRDSTGILVQATIKVAQNFLTGYNISFPSTSCPAGAGTTTAITPQAGCDVAMQFTSVISGSLNGDRQYRLEVVTGSFQFVNPLGSNTTTTTYTATSDHQGNIFAVVRVPSGVASQVGLVRVVDIATGVSNTYAFDISGAGATLTAIPSTFTFTGPDATTCGTGQADVYIFDGALPYTAVSTDPTDLQVAPISPNTQPGQFRLTASNSSVCLTNVQVIFQDAAGHRVTITVNTKVGAAAGAAPTGPPLAAAPTSLTLACGEAGTVGVIGGVGPYSTVSSTPRVTATVSGHTVTIRRLVGDTPPPAGPVVPASETVFISDGATAIPIAVTVPTAC